MEGSFVPLVQVDAWYDGELVYPNLPVTGGSVTRDAARAIHGALSLTVRDTDGTLIPTSYNAPLAPFGSELQVRCGLRTGAGTAGYVSLGWYRIDSSDPDESWDAYYRGRLATDPTWVARAVQVDVQASDRMSRIDEARFLAPEAPESLSSVVEEIKRLARDHVPIADLSAVDDSPIPASIAYQTSRTQAIQDLADVIGMVARINPNGALSLYPKVPSGDPVWTVTVGRNGQIVGWQRKLDRSSIYNAVISGGTTPEGVAVQGVVTEDSGPLRWGGPFGRVPYGHSSPLITSQEVAEADAYTRLQRLVSERVVPITVQCVANPALELDDLVAIALPDRTMTGTVTSITWPIPATLMTMVVTVPGSQVWG
jgi:hypothetical protein